MNTQYFTHDSNARNSDKVINLRMRRGAEGYGVYFMLLERLREEPDYTSVKDYNMLAFDLRVDASVVKSVIEDFGLFAFTADGKRFYSESFMQRMKVMDDTRSARSAGGKKAMEKRWGKKADTAPAEEPSLPLSEASQGTSDNSLITHLSKNDNNKNKIKENKIKTLSNESVNAGAGPRTPARGEVRDFVAEEKLGIDPDRFHDYMEARGWTVGGNPIHDWRAACRSWKSTRRETDTVRRAVKTDMELIRQAEQRRAAEDAVRAAAGPPVSPDEWRRRRGLDTEGKTLAQIIATGT